MNVKDAKVRTFFREYCRLLNVERAARLAGLDAEMLEEEFHRGGEFFYAMKDFMNMKGHICMSTPLSLIRQPLMHLIASDDPDVRAATKVAAGRVLLNSEVPGSGEAAKTVGDLMEAIRNSGKKKEKENLEDPTQWH